MTTPEGLAHTAPPDGRGPAAPANEHDSAPPARMHSPAAPADDIEDTDPGLARERTSLAWTRTAISFAALGGTLLKTAPPAGALILAMSAAVWSLGRMSRHRGGPKPAPRHTHLLITLTVMLVSLAALAVVLLAGSNPLRLRI